MRHLRTCHVLAVAVLAEVAGGSDNDIEAIDTGFDGDPGIVHVASYVGEDLGFQLRSCQNTLSTKIPSKLTPSLQRASQSFLDCSEAAGLVTSMSVAAVSIRSCICRGILPYSLHRTRQELWRS
jgi:hypothetical protein